jgi:hypothetical protein
LFVSPEEPWILDLGAIAHRGKAGQSTSIPTAVSTAGRETSSTSQEKVTNHLPVLVRRTQQVLISPSMGRWL